MGIGAIRFGGMAVFLNIGLGILSVIAIFLWPNVVGLSLGIMLALAGSFLGVVTLWGLAAYLTASDYDEANGVIFLMILFSLTYVGLSIANVLISGVPEMSSNGTIKLESGIGMQLANGIISLILFVLGFKLGKRIMGFSAQYDRPRIWLIVGLCMMSAYTLYFVYLFFMIWGLILGSGATVLAALGFMLVASLVWLAAYILVGVGLVQGADRLELEEEEPDYAY